MLIKKIVDLSWEYSEKMHLFPDAEQLIIRKKGNTFIGDNCELTIMDNFCMHYGTHLDCPAHIVKGGFRVDDKPASYFVGRGKVIDCSYYTSGSSVGEQVLEGVDISDVDFLFFYFGWSCKFGTDEQYGEYPVLDLNFASFLGKNTKLRGFGIDTNNCDVIGDESFVIHHALLGDNSKILYEAVKNLDQLVGENFILIAPPLLVKNAEGSPCRAVALITE